VLTPLRPQQQKIWSLPSPFSSKLIRCYCH
jgi:hypothetical protein